MYPYEGWVKLQRRLSLFHGGVPRVSLEMRGKKKHGRGDRVEDSEKYISPRSCILLHKQLIILSRDL